MNTKEWMDKGGWIDSGIKASESKGGISVVAGEKHI